jgi:hypothetical protein
MARGCRSTLTMPRIAGYLSSSHELITVGRAAEGLVGTSPTPRHQLSLGSALGRAQRTAGLRQAMARAPSMRLPTTVGRSVVRRLRQGSAAGSPSDQQRLGSRSGADHDERSANSYSFGPAWRGLSGRLCRSRLAAAATTSRTPEPQATTSRDGWRANASHSSGVRFILMPSRRA